MLTSFLCYIVTWNVRRLIEEVQPIGCSFGEVEISLTDDFQEHLGERNLPLFYWLKITGEAGRDDFGMSQDHLLVVSDRILQQMRKATLNDCEVSPFA